MEGGTEIYCETETQMYVRAGTERQGWKVSESVAVLQPSLSSLLRPWPLAPLSTPLHPSGQALLTASVSYDDFEEFFGIEQKVW